MRIVFVDECARHPYSGETLREKGMGGTEATVVRVSEALVREGHEVEVGQAARFVEERSYGVAYKPIRNIDTADVQIALRDPGTLKRFPGAILWCHDHPWGGGACPYAFHRDFVAETDPLIVAVSHYHAGKIREVIPEARVEVIENPIDDELQPDGTKHNPHKLLFASAPCKGLRKTLAVFDALRKRDSRFKLLVANPGYMRPDPGMFYKRRNVNYIGALPHWNLIRQMRTALCVFTANNEFPETFGLVFAEAYAVGTPVVAPDYGAVPEVIGKEGLLPADADAEAYIKRVLEVMRNRPDVRLRDDLRTSAVTKRWIALLTHQGQTTNKEKQHANTGRD